MYDLLYLRILAYEASRAAHTTLTSSLAASPCSAPRSGNSNQVPSRYGRLSSASMTAQMIYEIITLTDILT